MSERLEEIKAKEKILFDSAKATHVASYLLWKAGGTMKYLKLIKLMYLAEKESLLNYGERLTGDRLVSMDHGPVLSETYELLKGKVLDKGWSDWIEEGEDYTLTFKKEDKVDPEDPLDTFDELSEVEQEILDKIYKEFGGYKNAFVLANLTHNSGLCPEWEDPHGSSKTIKVSTLIDLNVFTEGKRKALKANIEESDNYKIFLNKFNK